MQSFRSVTNGLILMVTALLSPFAAVHATTIQYAATDLADVTPGEDLWRYNYSVSGRTFLQSEIFDIYFDPSLYANLLAGAAPNSDWDVLILNQPTPANLPPFDQGIFDAQASVDNPALTGTFSVSFVYLGAGSPGAQRFEVFDAAFSSIETGFTTAQSTVIPEPSAVLLCLGGLLVTAIRLTGRSKIHRR
jgi:hypothetical protein